MGLYLVAVCVPAVGCGADDCVAGGGQNSWRDSWAGCSATGTLISRVTQIFADSLPEVGLLIGQLVHVWCAVQEASQFPTDKTAKIREIRVIRACPPLAGAIPTGASRESHPQKKRSTQRALRFH